jgi:magnesium-transporting ATPase (P-type)
VQDTHHDTEPSFLPWAMVPDDVLAELNAVSEGLDAAEVTTRRERYGFNDLEGEARTGVWRVLLHQFTSPLIALLIAATVLSLVLREYVDAAVISAALLLNAVIGFIEELRAARSMEALQQLTPGTARVVRDGHEGEINPRELVPGDIVLVPAGSKAPADCRILHAAGAEVDESILTGESVPSTKAVAAVSADATTPDRHSMLHHGTLVSRGHVRAVVTATGSATELGRVASRMRGIDRVKTPLQQRMAGFSRIIALVVVGVCVIGLGAGLALGQDLKELALSLVALAVAAIPEGLPVVLTVALAISMQRMSRRRAIVRRLAAVETLGSCSAIGSDKTGTLTRNQMTLRALVLPEHRYDVSGDGLDTAGDVLREGTVVSVDKEAEVYLPLVAAALCNDASAVPADGLFDVVGDPTEVALLVAAAKAGLDKDEIEERYPRVAEIPFSAEHRFMATFNQFDGDTIGFVKGAPEAVLAMCVARADGGALDAATVLAQADLLAAEGMRVLATAYRVHGADTASLEQATVDLRFLALHGMVDPPRAEAEAAVAACHDAGVRVLMITGDHAITATSIARQLGIARADATAVTGVELERMDPAELDAIVERTNVFARVSPQHKLAIVESLRRGGHTVAVTGDGVNDAPALRAADIGVAMGQSGTDVAREAADIVLIDDDFASIVAAIEEGRVAFGNVRKTTFFLVSTGAAAILVVLASIFGRFDAPFIAAQLIWLNVVTNGVQDVGLAFEPGEPDVLRRRPRPRGEGVLSGLLWERAALTGVVMAAGTLALFFYDLSQFDDLERARTVALTTMVLFSILHVGNSRSEHHSAFSRSPLLNPFLFVGTVFALSIHIGAMYFEPTQRILRLQPLDAGTWLQMLAMAMTVVAVVELHKLLRGPRNEPSGT